MNKAILMGRLVRDPDVRYAQNEEGTAIARFTLAVDRMGKQRDDQPTADFITCVAFGKRAEFVGNYMHKGTKILLDGAIRTGSYTNKEGQKIYTTEIYVDSVEFAESKHSGGNETTSQDAPQVQQPQNQAPVFYAQNQNPVPQYQMPQQMNQQPYQVPYQPTYTQVQPQPQPPFMNNSQPVANGFVNIPPGVSEDGLPFN